MRKHVHLLSLATLSAIAINGCGQARSQNEDVVGSGEGLVSGPGVATLSIQRDWGTGYCANITIANNGTAPITSWTVVLQAEVASVSSIWLGQFTQSGSQITVTPISFNSTINVGKSVTVGYCAVTKSATNHTPTIASLSVVGGTTGAGGSSGVGGGTATGGSSSTGSGQATLDVNSDWNAGYCTNITLQNNSTVASTRWTLVINVPQANISSLWGGIYARNGDLVTVKSLSSSAVIAANGTFRFGYCATTTGSNHTPNVVSFDLASGQ
jgi:cellulase/cellobiase CelA1